MSGYNLTHLKQLEAESIHIIREVAAYRSSLSSVARIAVAFGFGSFKTSIFTPKRRHFASPPFGSRNSVTSSIGLGRVLSE
jgi:3'-phosphoadenosine 5'-phosphosulfate sulfotransferase (PAPS reductase)/FAD synthetase